jgi:hypothetical protein
MGKVNDLMGRRFGRLTVVRFCGLQNNKAAWEVACDCGGSRTYKSGDLVTGHVKSCGCMRNGKRKTPEYASWKAMRERCSLESNHAFHRYGGAGIRVCDRWNESFDAFLADMGPRPTGTSIDRIDNSKGYEPGNCRWATPTEQAQNQSQVRYYEFNGESRCISDWARVYGINVQTLWGRLTRRGLSIEQALTGSVA